MTLKAYAITRNLIVSTVMTAILIIPQVLFGVFSTEAAMMMTPNVFVAAFTAAMFGVPVP